MPTLASLYENTSQRTGKAYFTGYLGKAKLVMLRDERASEGQLQWTLFFTERPEKLAGGDDER